MATSEQPVSSRALGLLVTIAVLAAVKAAANIFFPLFLAILLYLILSPLVEKLADWRIPKAVSALGVTLFVLAIVVVGIGLLMNPAVDWVRSAPDKLEQAEQKVRREVPFLGPKKPPASDAPESESADAGEGIKIDSGSITSVTGTVLSTTGSVLSGIVIVVVSLFFLLIEGDRIFHRAGLLLMERDGEPASLLTDVQHIVSRYLGTVTLINVVLGVAIGCTLWGLGLPNALLWGVMAALFNFVPFLGALVGASVVFVVALLTFDGWLWVALPPACYVLINSIEGYFVTPTVLGRTVKLSPFMIFLVLIAGSWLGGVLGMIVAVPFLVTVKIVCDHLPRLNGVARLIGDEETARERSRPRSREHPETPAMTAAQTD
ncbi:MAG TPA: AI-2E family transporter [Phycisphaerae bacterium]|nr:AI-2E family transporter [Phycisphaerales bacterium]HRX85151.1 AI-2E family transporter [Phycisphaerae bacterium]